MNLASFAPTRWTLVGRAQGHDTVAQAALGELCAAYYEPVVAFLRAEGRSDDAARDLAHEFFAKVLAGTSLAGADETRGRFRSYLLGAVKHFLGDQRDRELAAKRGGGAETLALDLVPSPETGAGLEIAASQDAPPEHAFDRQWALTVIARALAVVEEELRECGRSAQFAVLQPWLGAPGGDPAALSQAAAASALGLSEGAVKVAIHRLRQRFREAVKAEIAETIPADADADEELGHLIAVLARG